MSDQGFWYTIEQGDSAASLAFENGLAPDTLWNHPSNRSLHNQRSDPNILLPGDPIFIPAIKAQSVPGAAGAKHKFVLKGVPQKISIQFLDIQQKPYANKPYLLQIDGILTKGNLNGGGWLIVTVKPNAKFGHIDIGENGELASCDILPGHLDPSDSITGIQRRLHNLGYYNGDFDNDPDNPDLLAAVTAFRLDQNLPQPDGDDLSDVRSQLLNLHLT